MLKPMVRASSLPSLFSCAPSVLNPDNLVQIETENESALLGTLVHWAIEQLLTRKVLALGELEQRLSKPDFARANMLFDNFLTAWEQASQVMLNPQTEGAFSVEFSNVVVTGHVDCFHMEPDHAYILDWKTGRQHDDHYHQVAAYSYGVWDKAGRPGKYVVYSTTVYLEDNSVKPLTFTAAMLERWQGEVEARMGDKRYTVGRKCATCSFQDTCPAYTKYAANAMALLENTNPYALTARSPKALGEVVDKLYVLDKAKERVRRILKDRVLKEGALDLGAGQEFTMVPTTETALDFKKGRKILEKRLGKKAMAALMEVSLNDALGEYAKLAARGKKKVARQELFDELDKAGAIVYTESSKMFRRPRGEQKLLTETTDE